MPMAFTLLTFNDVISKPFILTLQPYPVPWVFPENY
jgi:hypothetical protein